MANPARVADGQVITTTWGLAVADAVVRAYPNAAARDADLAGILPAELLGQAVVLTDSGSLLIYAGPLAGWRPPWSSAWGAMAAPVFSSTELNQGASLGELMRLSAHPFVAGRYYLVTVEICHQSDFPGFAEINTDSTGSGRHRTPICTVAMGEQMSTFNVYHAATTTRTGDVIVSIQTCFARGSLGQHRLGIVDVGPAANPTAIVRGADGVERVDRALLAPQYRGNYVEAGA